MIKKIYNNIIELANENGLYDQWTEDVGRDILEDYFDDYSDRNIVLLFLSDYLTNEKYEVEKPYWEDGGVDWRSQKIKIY
jgi:hypothetical protein